MSRAKTPRVSVQHLVVCERASVSGTPGPDNAYNLTGVGHSFAVPTGTVYPATVPSLDLFIRFFVQRSGTGEFVIRYSWVDAPAGRTRLLDEYGPLTIFFRPGQPIRNYMVRLRNLELAGSGRYALRLTQLRPHHVQGIRQRVLRTEYFVVVEQS